MAVWRTRYYYIVVHVAREYAPDTVTLVSTGSDGNFYRELADAEKRDFSEEMC